MRKGSQEIKCKIGATITVRSSGPFCVYALEKKKRTMILGPISANARILRYRLPAEIHTVYVETEKKTQWSIDWSYFSPSEHLDTTPIELPIGYQQPETLAEQMRRFIRQEVSQVAQAQSLGTFTEEDDFEEDDEPLTPYEMTDMQEVEEPWDENPKPPTTVAKPDDQVEDLVVKPEVAEKSDSDKAVDNEG